MITILLASLLAGGCGQAVVPQAVVAQPYVINPYVSQITVPYAESYWTLNPDEREALRLFKVQKLHDRIAELEQQLAECQQGQGTPTAPKIGSSALDDQVQTILTAKCTKCHSGAEPGGNLRLDQEGVYDLATRLAIANEVKLGTMPKPPAPPLSDADYQLIERWANEDAKGVRELLRQNRATPTAAPPSPGPESSTRKGSALKPVSAKEPAPRGVRRPLALELKEPPQ